MPARAIYEITEAGRRELEVHRDEALRNTKLPSDPVDLALNYIEDLSPTPSGPSSPTAAGRTKRR
jgi:DNA-binding PadR family transcriptional regulator